MLASGRARKFVPLIIAVLIAGFVVIQFDLVRLDEYSIPTFGRPQPAISMPQEVASDTTGPPIIPESDSDPIPEAKPEQQQAPAPAPVPVPAPVPAPAPVPVPLSADSKNDEDKDFASHSTDYLTGSPRKFNYRMLHSQSKPDGRFWPIDYAIDGTEGYNANVIPHPSKPGHWVVVAQRAPGDYPIFPAVELTCAAQLTPEGTLRCIDKATILPVTPSIVGKCEGDLIMLNLGGGPRDGRVFYGRDAPYILYGSQASYTCIGLWLHDLSVVSTEFQNNQSVAGSWFRDTAEIRRPPPWKGMEKNYFLFWDSQGTLHAHYDFWPQRSFAQINADGTAGPDLAPAVLDHDRTCMSKHMSALPASAVEAIHQATNSLQITMCKRSDPKCIPSDENTFVMHIYHLQSYYHFHGVYEPFVWLFKRSSPFELYAVSPKPFWIAGRNPLTIASDAYKFRNDTDAIPVGHTEMFYITSWNWKNPGQYDHGYIDDVVMIAFGIEDSRSGVLDVTVGDMLQDLAFCDMD